MQNLQESKCARVLEYLKQNNIMLKNMKILLYTYFYDISLKVLRPTLPFLRSPNIGKIRVKVEPKTNFFYSELLHQGC